MVPQSNTITSAYICYLEALPLLVRSLPQPGLKVQSSQVLVIPFSFQDVLLDRFVAKRVQYHHCYTKWTSHSSFVYFIGRVPF